MNRKNPIYSAVLITLLAVCWAGCEPISEEDKAFFDEQERIRGERIAAMRAASVVVTMEEAIEHVRNYPADEGSQTMEAWVSAQLADKGGQVFFPKWTAARRGSNIREVNYEFMFMDGSGKMSTYSYSWDLDILDMTVSQPVMRHVEENDMPDEVMKKLHRRRVEEHEQALR